MESVQPTIRALTTKELPKCEPFGLAFFAEKQLPGTFSMDIFTKTWTAFLGVRYKATIFGLWKGEELIGLLGGMVYPDLNTGEEIATELFWYVLPEHRGGSGAVRLVKRFKEWAKNHGAVRWRFIHMLAPDEKPESVKLAGFYEKLGMRPLEVCFDGSLED